MRFGPKKIEQEPDNTLIYYGTGYPYESELPAVVTDVEQTRQVARTVAAAAAAVTVSPAAPTVTPVSGSTVTVNYPFDGLLLTFPLNSQDLIVDTDNGLGYGANAILAYRGNSNFANTISSYSGVYVDTPSTEFSIGTPPLLGASASTTQHLVYKNGVFCALEDYNVDGSYSVYSPSTGWGARTAMLAGYSNNGWFSVGEQKKFAGHNPTQSYWFITQDTSNIWHCLKFDGTTWVDYGDLGLPSGSAGMRNVFGSRRTSNCNGWIVLHSNTTGLYYYKSIQDSSNFTATTALTHYGGGIKTMSTDGRYLYSLSGVDIYRQDFLTGATTIVFYGAGSTYTPSGMSLGSDGRLIMYGKQLSTTLPVPPTADPLAYSFVIYKYQLIPEVPPAGTETLVFYENTHYTDTTSTFPDRVLVSPLEQYPDGKYYIMTNLSGAINTFDKSIIYKMDTV